MGLGSYNPQFRQHIPGVEIVYVYATCHSLKRCLPWQKPRKNTEKNNESSSYLCWQKMHFLMYMIWCTWGSMTLSAWKVKVNVNIFIGFRSLKCHIILVGHFYGTGQLKSLRMITFPPSISATATHFWGYGIFRSFHIPTWWFPWGRYVVVGLVSWGVDVLGTSRFQA